MSPKEIPAALPSVAAPARILLAAMLTAFCTVRALAQSDLDQGFASPPDAARPWVYWFVMDGNLNREGITADLEAMKRVGIGGVLFMEVDVGIPKGPTKFMSPQWRELFKHANEEAARLGLQITMPASPGWTGSGGPWVKPEQSMQKLVFSEKQLTGPQKFQGDLPQPPIVAGFYRDAAVLAFPTPPEAYRIEDIAEKALYVRGHYSSEKGVKAILPMSANYPAPRPAQVVPLDGIVDLTEKLDAQGRLTWDVPPGNWTIMRFGHTSTGANTRPAPEPGLGLECDKLDKAALDAHFSDFLGKLMADIGPLAGKSLVSLHIDSWEMGPQNWTARFPQEFRKRRGYDLLKYLPVMSGRVVGSLEISERFLWDLRQTVLELITENHSNHLAKLAHEHGMKLSIEPYDGTPCDDMTYGSRADVPMGEFWWLGFNTSFSCTEAASIAHTYGKRIVQAEAFTSVPGEDWRAHPANLKALGDWAYCEGINRFVIHRYAHQPWLDRWPGMTMGPYGIHFERTQTWWEQSKAWVEYMSRCQFLLQQGLPVADICYVMPEASPQVFRAPASATVGNPPTRRGYNFDACTPEALLTRMSVKDGRLVMPDGMSYRVLVLPNSSTMTSQLLRKIKELANAGATIVGPRPSKSPSLAGYPECDVQVKKLADELWGGGRVIEASATDAYPDYKLICDLLAKMGVAPDFESDQPLRYTHRRDADADIYFISNGQDAPISANCTFRISGKAPEIWNAVTGEKRLAASFRQEHGRTIVPLEFEPSGSLFLIFRRPTNIVPESGQNFPRFNDLQEITGPWSVHFSPWRGGPPFNTFDSLTDWTKRPEEGIKFYSGTATYRKRFTAPSTPLESGQRLFLDLGRVEVIAQVKLNGRDVGVLWKTPFRADITDAIKSGENDLEVEVVNLWPNRLIRDQSLPEDKRFTRTTWNPFKKDSPLLPSGLLGPVTLQVAQDQDRRVLRSFDYKGVTLDDGPLKRQFDSVREYYLNIPNDNLLKGFRQRAAQFAPGADMGGWYSNDVFHVFGQILSGLARMYAATGDPAVRAKADYLVSEFAKCIEKDGYFFYSRKPNARHYIYDKMVGGLVDMYVYAGNKDALTALSRITDWAIANLERSRKVADGSTEWYTLSENLYRAYLATGDVKYRDFAKVWEYTPYWSTYARGGDIFAKRPDGGQNNGYHAYSHVNTLSGAAAAYRVTGDPKYLNTIVRAYDYLQAHQCFATGGYGPDELLAPAAELARRLQMTHNSFETQCGGWACFKLCRQLIEFTGDARYGDWIEKLVINGIGASISMTGDGRVFYYADYSPDGASKRNHDTPWTCCTGTRPMAVADFHSLIYFKSADALCVNLYTPSTVQYAAGTTTVTVKQTTRFPESDEVNFQISCARPAEFALRLRVPGWLTAPMQVSINTQPINGQVDAQHWQTLRRTWRDGDRVRLILPTALKTVRFQPDRPYPLTIMRGPAVLAIQGADASKAISALKNGVDCLEPAPLEPLVYRIKSATSVLIRPFYNLGEGEPYVMTFDPAAPMRIGHRAVTFRPNWNDSGGFRFTNVVGATAEASFDGTGIRWLGFRYDDAGRGEVRIDGKVVATVDQYGPGRDLPFDWKIDSLAPGKHTIKITLLAEKTAASRDRFLNVAGFEVLGEKK